MASADAQPPVEGYKLTGIAARAYQHPADKAASAALSSIPQLDRVVRKLIELGYERALRQTALGASVRLGQDQLPERFRAAFREAGEAVGAAGGQLADWLRRDSVEDE